MQEGWRLPHMGMEDVGLGPRCNYIRSLIFVESVTGLCSPSLCWSARLSICAREARSTSGSMSRVVAVLVATLPLPALLVLLIVHDIKTRRRPHLATVLAILFAVVARPVALAIGNSTFGQAFTAGLYAP
jgi:hypothetical protein